MNGVRFAHTNIVAKDWRRFVAFYVDVFGGRVVPPERDLSGEWLDNLTGISNVHIEGAHVAFAGYGEDGPTLEIFSYSPAEVRSGKAGINGRGLCQILCPSS